MYPVNMRLRVGNWMSGAQPRGRAVERTGSGEVIAANASGNSACSIATMVLRSSMAEGGCPVTERHLARNSVSLMVAKS